MTNITSEIRSFNRFYVSHLDILDQFYLESQYSVTEIRIIHEIAEAQQTTAKNICGILNLDKGYMSRVVKRLIKDGVIEKCHSVTDRRAFTIKLTTLGTELLKELNDIADDQTKLRIQSLTTIEQEKLVDAMATIKKLLKNEEDKIAPVNITYRYDLRPGDIGYIIHLHGKIYNQESGFSSEFESYVVETFHHFLADYRPEKDRLWLAELNNQIVGCIAIVHQTDLEAQLRWFLLDPSVRGLGIGKKLLGDALDFCRVKGYKNIHLLTTNMQERALDMYKQAGFELSETQEVSQWGNTFLLERYDLHL